MSIFTYFENLKPTGDQLEALNKIETFLHDEKRVFILKGYAGTGKTTLLRGIAHYLKKEQRLGALMAPTGRAATIIEDKTGISATTIHKGIYNMDNLHSYVEKVEGKDTFKFFFGLGLPSDKKDLVYIVDEASMIGNKFNEAEFFRFGSGHLLDDLLKYVDLYSKLNIKIIFLGDPAQLPPVGEKKSLALEKDYFLSKELNVQEFELTEVLRQTKESGIIKNAKYYRELIFSEKVAENNFDCSQHDVEHIDPAIFEVNYFKSAPIPQLNGSIVITFSNRLALDYNRLIRGKYYNETKVPLPGDILQVVQNNYANEQIPLFNGEFIHILSVDNKVEKQSAKVSVNNKIELITLNFREIEVQNQKGKGLKLKIIDDLLDSKHPNLSAHETKALYINFCMRCEHEPNTLAFKDAIKADPYFNALRAKYGYAITGHKSQGGEWQNAFIDFEGRYGTSMDVLRWTYTALTRASSKLFVMNPPRLKQISFKNISFNIEKINKYPVNSIVYPEVPATPYHSIDSHPIKRIKYFEMIEKFSDLNYSIQNIISKPYLERYFVSVNSKNYVLDLSHNNSGIFTNYKVDIKDEQGAELLDLFEVANPWVYKLMYTPPTDFLNTLHQNILAAMTDIPIQIMGIDDKKFNNYYISYFFKTEAQGAYINFYFNNVNQLTQVLPKSTLGNEDQVLKEYLQNLQKQA